MESPHAVLLVVLIATFAICNLVQAEDQEGFISLDCGLPPNEVSPYIEPITGLRFSSDSSFIQSGIIGKVDKSFETLKSYMTLRYFPDGKRNCYNLIVKQGTTYMIRATALYGNYDGHNNSPKFDLYIGANFWTTLDTGKSITGVGEEITYIPRSNSLDVCLVKTDTTTPFLSLLELRPLDKDTYLTTSGSLKNFRRYYLSNSESIIAYPEDVKDRIWESRFESEWKQISTTLKPNNSIGGYFVPQNALMTAAIPANESAPFSLTEELDSPADELYVYLHFSEVQSLKANESREFDMLWGGEVVYDAFSPEYLNITTIQTNTPVTCKDGKCNLELRRTKNSTLPPLLNAIEFYTVVKFPQLETNETDVKFPKKPLSHTFAEQFVKICNRSDLAWELFTCERIRNSCARIYSRSDLISSTPPSSPAVATNMSPLSYREEKKLQKERERAREAREKEDKARMVKALDDGKARSSSGKGKSSGITDPISESKTSDHRDQKKMSSGKDVIRISDSRSSRSSREKENSEGGHTATSSRKRRNEESEVPPLQRKSRSRLNDEKNPSEDAGPSLGSKPEEKGDSQRAPESELPTQLLILPSRDSENRESVRQEIPIPTAPPKSPADFMRNFTPVGMRIPPFSDLKEVNRANYFRFADKLGELMLEYNTTFSCHESQLFPVNELDGLRTRVTELEDEIRQLKEMEEENARAVAKANEIRERMLEAEARCNLLEIAKTDLSEKLNSGKNMYLEACDKITSLEAEVKRSEEWCKVVAEKRDEELAAAKKDERIRLRELYSGLASKHETYFKAISDNEMIGTRLAETRANRELLEEILKGEIPDIKAELESVKKDEAEAEKKAREVSALKPQPNEFAHLFVATPPEPEQKASLPEDDVAIDEFGTNTDLMAGQDFEAAVLPEEMQQDPDVKDQ